MKNDLKKGEGVITWNALGHISGLHGLQELCLQCGLHEVECDPRQFSPPEYLHMCRQRNEIKAPEVEDSRTLVT
jgi:rRNA maturation protein Nop10